MNRLVLAAALLLPLACVDAPERSGSESSKAADKKAGDASKPTAAEPVAKPATGSTELSAEELALIESDPKTLTPEQNRKRGYALRKKVMQNPDSPEAKALEDARQAALSGELPPEQIKPAEPGVASEPAPDPGLVIELPEHLKNK